MYRRVRGAEKDNLVKNKDDRKVPRILKLNDETKVHQRNDGYSIH